MDFASLPELTANYFSRKQEASADRAGLETLKTLGADARCAAGFFDREDSVFDAYLEFSSTHPQTARRKEEILAFARTQGGAENFEQTPRCRPLPDELRNAFPSLEKP
jgi:predicted Zn-dependent protease